MYRIKHTIILLLLAMVAVTTAQASEEGEKLNVSEIVTEHIKDSHEWHVTEFNGHPVIIHLPVIVNSSTGWHVFMTSEFEHEATNGMKKGPYNLALCSEGTYAGKIVEIDSNGTVVNEPLDLSITKTVAVMFINVIILLACILGAARWYKGRKPGDEAPKGFVGFVEMMVMYVVDNIIKPGVGKGYEKYTPYLLTCFFFIFICNVMGLIPFPPGSGNVTGNISVTFFLAFCTFVIVQFSGNKHYWKDIFWPDVPTWLKAPLPLIPVIEFVGIFTKPFALMIRLFANMMAGHAIAVAILCIIFLMASAGTGMLVGMGALSIIMSIFMMCLECLVCFIQAMVFTMLSATFIGLARTEPEHE